MERLGQSFGALAHWHPHLHLVVTDGAFRRDGTFAASPAHDVSVLAEAWRRAVPALFVREGWFDEDIAASMLAWPHSGFGAHAAPARKWEGSATFGDRRDGGTLASARKEVLIGGPP